MIATKKEYVAKKVWNEPIFEFKTKKYVYMLILIIFYRFVASGLAGVNGVGELRLDVLQLIVFVCELLREPRLLVFLVASFSVIDFDGVSELRADCFHVGVLLRELAFDILRFFFC